MNPRGTFRAGFSLARTVTSRYRTEMTENDVDVRHADGLRISASTLRVGRHRGRRRSGMRLFTRRLTLTVGPAIARPALRLVLS
jgi:hypothetical protein